MDEKGWVETQPSAIMISEVGVRKKGGHRSLRSGTSSDLLFPIDLSPDP